MKEEQLGREEQRDETNLILYLYSKQIKLLSTSIQSNQG